MWEGGERGGGDSHTASSCNDCAFIVCQNLIPPKWQRSKRRGWCVPPLQQGSDSYQQWWWQRCLFLNQEPSVSSGSRVNPTRAVSHCSSLHPCLTFKEALLADLNMRQFTLPETHRASFFFSSPLTKLTFCTWVLLIYTTRTAQTLSAKLLLAQHCIMSGWKRAHQLK